MSSLVFKKSLIITRYFHHLIKKRTIPHEIDESKFDLKRVIKNIFILNRFVKRTKNIAENVDCRANYLLLV